MKMRNIPGVATLCLAVWFAIQPSVPAAQWNGHEESIGGVLNVFNPAATVETPLTLQPKELWHIGQDDDQEGGPLGHIIDVAADRDGNTYLLDETMIVVKMFDPKGNFIRDLGRQGEGPGEFSLPRRICVLPDGAIGVIQMMPARIVMLTPDNTPLGYFADSNRNVGRQRFSQAVSSTQNTVVSRSVSSIDGNINSTRNTLDIHDNSGGFIATAIEETRKSRSRGMSIEDGREFNGLATCWDVSADGSLFVAPHFNEYKILVFDGNAESACIIHTPYESVRRSEKNLAELEAQNDVLRKVEGESVDINPYVRDIRSLHCRPEGELWVLSSRGIIECPALRLGNFHVYDSDGHYRHNVCLQVDYDPERDDFIIDGNRLYILKESQMRPATVSSASHGNSMLLVSSRAPNNDQPDEGEARPFSVICYELPR